MDDHESGVASRSPLAAERSKARVLSAAAAAVFGLSLAQPCLAAPPAPSVEPPPIPDQSTIEKMLLERMGKTQGATPRIAQDGIEVVVQVGHSAEITKVALSPDGKYILSGSFDESAKLWDVASGQEVRTLSGFAFGGPAWVSFTDDSREYLASDGRTLTVYDTLTGQSVRQLPQGDYLPAAAVSSDGRLGVASQFQGGKRSVAIVDLKSGEVLWKVPVDRSESVLALSADGTTLLTGRPIPPTAPQTQDGANRDLHVWDVAARRGPRTIQLGFALGEVVAISTDGHLFAQELGDHSIAVYDLVQGRQLQTLSGGWNERSRATTGLLFSPDGHRLARATYGGAILWELTAGRPELELPHSAVSFSHDGRTLVLGRASGGIPLLHDLTTGQETELRGATAGVLDLALAGNERFAVAAMDDGSARLWDLSTGQIVRGYQCPRGSGVYSVSTGTRGALLATGCTDGSAWLWDVDSGRRLRQLTAPAGDSDPSPVIVRFRADESYLAIGRRESLTIWDTRAEMVIARIELPAPAATERSTATRGPDARWITALAVHPSQELVAVGTGTDITLWNVSSGTLKRRLGAPPPSGPQSGRRGQSASERGAGGWRGALGQMFGAPRFGMGSDSPPRGAPRGDLAELMRSVQTADVGESARALAFSADGTALLTLGNTGRRTWDVATGQEIRVKSPGQAPGTVPDIGSLMDAILPSGLGPGQGGALALSPDGRIAAYGVGHVIKLWEPSSGREMGELIGHASEVTSLVFVPSRPTLISGSRDGSVRLWDLKTGKETAALIALGESDAVAVTPAGYYRASKASLKELAFRVRGQLYPFEQFDLRFNRPDIVLEQLGLSSAETILGYRNAYRRRLLKTGFTEAQLAADLHAPEVEVLSDVPPSTSDSSLTVRVRASDSASAIERLNVYVNDVPLHGTTGLRIGEPSRAAERELRIPLVPGRNKLQFSAVNQQGAESLRRTLYTNAVGEFPKADVYLLGIGVSHYQNSAYDLRFAAKDAGDLATTYAALESHPGAAGHVHTLLLTDSRATRGEIQHAKEWLRQAQPQDLVVVFAAGHGITDDQANYFFGTYDIDAAHPAINGLPYESFEDLFDGIPALQKVLLLDTCFSGEIDKDGAVVVNGAQGAADGKVTMRAFRRVRGVTVVADHADAAPLGDSGTGLPPSMLRFQQDWFADLRRGTGAAVISSSSGDEYSFEGEQWHNGVFTYSLLQGIRDGAADANGDHIITVSELQAYVIEQVRKLTAGGQNPTVRRENLDYDFPVYY